MCLHRTRTTLITQHHNTITSHIQKKINKLIFISVKIIFFSRSAIKMFGIHSDTRHELLGFWMAISFVIIRMTYYFNVSQQNTHKKTPMKCIDIPMFQSILSQLLAFLFVWLMNEDEKKKKQFHVIYMAIEKWIVIFLRSFFIIDIVFIRIDIAPSLTLLWTTV